MMKRNLIKRNLLTVGLWAAASMGVTLAIFVPANLEAVSPAPAAKEIKTPTLKVGACEMSLQWGESNQIIDKSGAVASLKPGSAPTVKLVVTNSGNAEAAIAYGVELDGSESAPPGSRAMPSEQELWKESGYVRVPAGETTAVTVSPKADLKHGMRGTMKLVVDKQTLRGVRFQVPLADAKTPAAKPSTPAAPTNVVNKSKSSEKVAVNSVKTAAR